jgi:serine O-acetyltransferase
MSRMLTGVEIHPAAEVGEALFIDHGAGVVIGETAEIGDNVTLYQGVTLGGTGFARGKRHPTVEDDVVVGSGAKLLGPIRVGRGAKVGANSVVIHDVPPNSTVVGNPGHPVRVEGRRPGGPDADWAHLPDPVADAIKALARRVAELEDVIECRRMYGDPDYLMRVAVKDADAYEHFLMNVLADLPGLARMTSQFTMKTIKSGGRLPV